MLGVGSCVTVSFFRITELENDRAQDEGLGMCPNSCLPPGRERPLIVAAMVIDRWQPTASGCAQV